MCRLEVKAIEAGNTKYFENVCNYIAKDCKCEKGYIGATNAYLPTNRSIMVEEISSQMNNDRIYHHQENSRLGLHLTVAFAPSECKSLNRRTILNIGYQLAEKEFPDCTTYFAVHDHSENLHLHMLVGTVKHSDGRMYACGPRGWRSIGHSVADFLKEYVPEEDIAELQFATPKKEKN